MRKFDELTHRFPELLSQIGNMEKALVAMLETYHNEGKILLCGNGGSAADCDHICGELLKGFLKKRTPEDDDLEKLARVLESEEQACSLQMGIPAISLPSMTAALTAAGNDLPPELIFAQLTLALGAKKDLLIGISTSGNSKNVIQAVKVAKARGMKTIALTGESGGMLGEIADIVIKAPAKETYLIQEYHLPIYHALCAQLEEILFFN